MAALAGCKALPPPPILTPHAATPAEPVGATTAMLVFGFAGEALGGGGVGVALRVEHQTTERTAYGVELAGGRGDEYEHEDHTTFRQHLVALRGYGRFTPRDAHAFDFTYGAGLSRITSGLVTGSLSGSVETSYANAYAEPLFAVGLATVVPIAKGDVYYERPLDVSFGEPPLPHGDFPLFGAALSAAKRTALVPHADVVLALDAGLVVPLSDTGNRLSLDLGIAYALFTDDTLLALSAAEAQRFAK